MAYLKILHAVAVVAVIVSLQEVCEAQATACQTTFLNTFTQCVTNSSLNAEHFLWLTRDGTTGKQPPDLPAFTQQACQKEQVLFDCSSRVLSRVQVVAATVCSDSDKSAVVQFHQKVFINLHKKCAHPCRDQLVPSLRQCYTTAGLNAALFRPNITLPRYDLLGNTNDVVNAFCSKRITLVECMQTKVAGCPEAPQILASIGVDLQSFNETIAFLCDNSHIYLLGARCSANVSAEETKCQNTMTMELRQLEYQFQTLNISEAVFAADICRIRMDHTRCDLYGLARRDNVTKCPDVVLGLRREQECALLPVTCKRVLADRVIDMCDPVRFLRDKRQNFITASGLTSGATFQMPSSYTFVAVSILFYAVFLFDIGADLGFKANK